MPTLTTTQGRHLQTYAVTLTHNPGAVTMPAVSPLSEVRARFTQQSATKRALAKAYQDAAGQLLASADADDAFVINLETFVMENATELVNEAIERIKADEAAAE
jgi:formaldehyde-activating enzyme involved in methanogenesis